MGSGRAVDPRRIPAGPGPPDFALDVRATGTRLPRAEPDAARARAARRGRRQLLALFAGAGAATGGSAATSSRCSATSTSTTGSRTATTTRCASSTSSIADGVRRHPREPATRRGRHARRPVRAREGSRRPRPADHRQPGAQRVRRGDPAGLRARGGRPRALTCSAGAQPAVAESATSASSCSGSNGLVRWGSKPAAAARRLSSVLAPAGHARSARRPRPSARAAGCAPLRSRSCRGMPMSSSTTSGRTRAPRAAAPPRPSCATRTSMARRARAASRGSRPRRRCRRRSARGAARRGAGARRRAGSPSAHGAVAAAGTRQAHDELAAAPGPVAVRLDRAAVQLDQALAPARGRCRARPRRARAPAAAWENMSKTRCSALGRDADAVVARRRRTHVAALAPRREPDRPPRGRCTWPRWSAG